MKTFTAALAVLFVAALCYQVSSTQPSVDPSPYCETFATKPLPLRSVKSYWRTSRYPPAVIFFTTMKRLVCADPEEEWVKNRMKQVDRKIQG